MIIDEAHSSQSGETATELKAVLGGLGLLERARELAEEEDPLLGYAALTQPSVPGMGQDLQPETRLPERVTTTVEKRKGEAARPA